MQTYPKQKIKEKQHVFCHGTHKGVTLRTARHCGTLTNVIRLHKSWKKCAKGRCTSLAIILLSFQTRKWIIVVFVCHMRKGIKPGTNARKPEPKSGTKYCQQNIAVKHACIELKFGLNVDYRFFFEMHISIFHHLPYFYYMQAKYKTMSLNTDPGPTFSVLTMSRNS